MNNQQLDELLRSLPRETASEHLAGKVLASLNHRRRRPARARRPVFGVVLVAAVLVAGLSVFLWLDQRARRAEIREEIEALRSEHQLLQARLMELKRKPPARPVVYLGGDDQVDYVLDLRKYLRAQVDGKPRRQIPLRHTGGSL